MTLSPSTHAAAYRIWAVANPLGWDCTYAEISKETGFSHQKISAVAKVKGWTGRFRATETDFARGPEDPNDIADAVQAVWMT